MQPKELHFSTFSLTLIFYLAKYSNCLVTELAGLFLKFSDGDLARPDQFAFTFLHCVFSTMSEASYEGHKLYEELTIYNLA